MHNDTIHEIKPTAAAALSARLPTTDAPSRLSDTNDVTLCDALDRLLNKGAVVKGEITICVANVELVYLGFNVLLASVQTARDLLCTPPQGPVPKEK